MLNISTFKFQHSIKPLVDPVDQRVIIQGSETEETAEVIHIQQPLGMLLVVRAFGGENLYMLHITGGHKMNVSFTVQTTDNPILQGELTPDTYEPLLWGFSSKMSPGMQEGFMQWAKQRKLY